MGMSTPIAFAQSRVRARIVTGVFGVCSTDRLLRPRRAAERSSPAPRAVQQAEGSGAEAGSVAMVMASASFVRTGLSSRHGASGTHNAECVAAHQGQADHADAASDTVALTQS